MSLHPYRLHPEIDSRFEASLVKERLRRTDLVGVDIDECIFPGFSQTYLGHLIFYKLLSKPLMPTDIRFMPQLLGGGAYLRKVNMLRRLGRAPTNLELMERYQKTMRQIPLAYFLACVPQIPKRAYAGVHSAITTLGRLKLLGWVSFGIQLIAEEFARHFNQNALKHVVFYEANHIQFAAGPDGRPAFKGYRSPRLTEPEHKRIALEKRLHEFGGHCPLVIGNGMDEAEMAHLARDLGGLAIGFCPSGESAPHFDLVVRSRDWRSLSAILCTCLA